MQWGAVGNDERAVGAHRATSGAYPLGERWRKLPEQLAPLLAGAALLTLGAGCRRHRPRSRGARAGHVGPGVAGQRGGPALRPRDQFGAPISPESLRGKVVARTSLCSSCPDVCPLTLGEFMGAKRLLGADADRVAFVFASVDGERDAAALRAYVGAFEPAFVGPQGSPATLDRIGSGYDLAYRKEESGASGGFLIAHTTSAFPIDPEGRLRIGYPYGTLADAPATDVRAMLALPGTPRGDGDRAVAVAPETPGYRGGMRGEARANTAVRAGTSEMRQPPGPTAHQGAGVRTRDGTEDGHMIVDKRTTGRAHQEKGVAPFPASRQSSRRGGLVYAAWLQALVATAGSLYFSEVMKLPPCVLCWYQRIAMYPLVVVLTVGILLREPRLRLYVLPLSLVGLAISIYHNLLYYGVIPESIRPCTSGVSCTARQIEWLGFITIPLLALVAFSVVNVIMACYLPEGNDVHSPGESDQD